MQMCKLNYLLQEFRDVMSTTINDLTVIWVLQMCLYVFNTMRRQFDEEVE